MIYPLLFFVLGFVVSVFCTPWVIRLAHRGIGLDYAHESRKKQEVPIPRLGGMPLMLAISVGLLVIFAVRPSNATNWFPILIGSLMMYGLGLWDDLRRLGAKVKLTGQIVTALLVYTLGLSIDKFTYPGATGCLLYTSDAADE